MAEPERARKFEESEILPEDAVVGPGTFQNVDNGRIVRKDHFGPIPPSGQSKRYVMLSNDPTHGLSEEEASAHRNQVRQDETATSYESPSTGRTVHTGEVASGGHYKCTECGNEINMHGEGRVPPCSVCKHTEWRRA